MENAILTTQSKGQIMLPKAWRDDLQTKVFQAIKEKDVIILKPVDVASHEEVMKTAKKVIKQNMTLLKSLADK
ncbi:MAG: hypothetical protein ABID45_01710 [Patescibacteria group bacterium]